MEKNHGFATWGDAFNGVRGEKALQKAYSRATDFRELVHRLPGRPPFMLGRDVAAVYGVTTERLMQQARRNMDLENPKFLFELTREEAGAIWAQNGTPQADETLQNARFTHLPYGYTQLGANQIAFYLKSEVAQHRSTQILEAFIHFEDLARKGELPGNGSIGQGLLLSDAIQKQGMTVSDVAAICWFRGKGLTQAEVGKIFGVSRDRIQLIESTLRKAGIKLPPVIANRRVTQMWQFFNRLIGFKGTGLPLLKGGAL